MNGKPLAAIAASAAMAVMAMASNASAETLLFSYAETGGIDFSFDQSSTPTPITYSLGSYADVPVSNWSGDIGAYSSIYWYSAAASGQFDTSDGSYVVFGPQIYTGPESNPVFAPGVFSAADQTNGLSGVLTVTAVPEPTTWALMLVGFGGLGAVMRAHRRADRELAELRA